MRIAEEDDVRTSLQPGVGKGLAILRDEVEWTADPRDALTLRSIGKFAQGESAKQCEAEPQRCDDNEELTGRLGHALCVTRSHRPFQLTKTGPEPRYVIAPHCEICRPAPAKGQGSG